MPDDLVVADEWFGRFTDFDIKFSSDHQKALSFATGKRGADGSMRYVWQDCVAGTDPTNSDDKFTASITFDENDKPVIGWSVSISLKAGSEEIAMARKALEERIRIGNKVTEIIDKPDIVASPSADGSSLTFTIAPIEGKQAFIMVRL